MNNLIMNCASFQEGQEQGAVLVYDERTVVR